MRKVLYVILAAAVLLSADPLFFHADSGRAVAVLSRSGMAAEVESGVCGDSISWTLDSEGLLTISGAGDMYDYPNFRNTSHEVVPWDRMSVLRVSIGDGITGIGKYAFSDHYSLTEVRIPDSVVSVGEGAFQYCSALNSVTLPEKLSVIPDKLFSLSGLRYVSVPAGVTQIGNSAFYYCRLIEVNYGGTEAQWNKVRIGGSNEMLSGAYMTYEGGAPLTSAQSGSCGDGVNWRLTTDGTLTIEGSGKMNDYQSSGLGADHPWCAYRSHIRKIVIGPEVTSVGAWAFFDCFHCTSVEISEGVQKIGAGAFACTALSSVNLPDSVSSLGVKAFYQCGALRQIRFPKGLKVINSELCEYCGNLCPPELPPTVERIEYSAFYGCDFDEITLPETVTYIGYNFASVDSVRFLGPVPRFDHEELLFAFIRAKASYCRPEYFDDYQAVYQKWRAEGTLSDGDVRVALSEKAVTLTAEDPSRQLSVSVENGSAAGMASTWSVEKPYVASVDQNGTITATGHGRTMVYVEVSVHGAKAMAGCEVTTKRNDLMVAQLPKQLKSDFPVTCGVTARPFGEVDFTSYEPGKLAETDPSNPYYQELLSLTNDLTAGCADDVQKAKAISGWVSQNVTYGGNIGIGNQAGQAYAVYLSREGHCEGFAKLNGFLLHLAGIPCCLVAGEGHMWNIALLDGEWKMIEPQTGEVGIPYNDCDSITWIGFGEDDCCFVIDSTDGIKLTGVGNHCLPEEREGFTSVTVPDYVSIIYGSAFRFCRNLEHIILPDSIREITRGAFSECGAIRNIDYAGTREQWSRISINGTGNAVLQSAALHCQGDPATEIPTPSGDALPGDVDGNGKLEPADARLALRASVQLEQYEPGSARFLAADANRDGVIGSDDARMILRAAVNLEDSARWGK